MSQNLFSNKAFQISMMLLGMSIAAATQGFSQSFECSRAQIPSEMAICNNENLLLQDEKVGELIGNALMSANNSKVASAITRDHAKWLRTRNACRNDFLCLEKSYDERIHFIETNGFKPKT